MEITPEDIDLTQSITSMNDILCYIDHYDVHSIYISTSIHVHTQTITLRFEEMTG